MNKQATVTALKGEAIVISKDNIERKLTVGDKLALGDKIKTEDKASLVIYLHNGKTLQLESNDSLTIDQSVLNTKSFGNEAILTDANSLQQAILRGENLEELEATAAGDNTGASLSPANFATSGHESNITASTKDIADTPSLNEIQSDQTSGTAQQINFPTNNQAQIVANPAETQSNPQDPDEPISNEAAKKVAPPTQPALQAPNEPTLTANPDDASVKITPPKDKAVTRIDFSYTDENNEEKTGVAIKDNNGKWNLITEDNSQKDTTLYIDPDSGIITIPNNATLDGSDVSAKSTSENGLSSQNSTIKAPDVPPAKQTIIANEDGSVNIKLDISKYGNDENGKAFDNRDINKFELKIPNENGGTTIILINKNEDESWTIDNPDSDIIITPNADKNGFEIYIPRDSVADQSSVSVSATDKAGNTATNNETAGNDIKPQVQILKITDDVDGGEKGDMSNEGKKLGSTDNALKSNDSTPEIEFNVLKDFDTVIIKIGDKTYTYDKVGDDLTSKDENAPKIEKTSGGFKFSPNLQDGTHTISIEAKDGNQVSEPAKTTILIDTTPPEGHAEFDTIDIPVNAKTSDPIVLSGTYHKSDKNGASPSIVEGSTKLIINGKEFPTAKINFKDDGTFEITGITKGDLATGNKDSGKGHIELKFDIVDEVGNKTSVSSDDKDRNGKLSPDEIYDQTTNKGGNAKGDYIYDEVKPTVKIISVTDDVSGGKTGDISENGEKLGSDSNRLITNDATTSIEFSVSNKADTIIINAGNQEYTYTKNGENFVGEKDSYPKLEKTSSGFKFTPPALNDGDQKITIKAKDGKQEGDEVTIKLDIDTNQKANAELSVPEITSTKGTTEVSISINSNDNENPTTQGHDYSGELKEGTLSIGGISYELKPNGDKFEIIRKTSQADTGEKVGEIQKSAITPNAENGSFEFKIPVKNADLAKGAAGEKIVFNGKIQDTAGNEVSVENSKDYTRPQDIKVTITAIKDNVKGGVENGDDIIKSDKNSDGDRTHLSNDARPSIEFKFTNPDNTPRTDIKDISLIIKDSNNNVVKTVTTDFIDKGNGEYSIELNETDRLTSDGEYKFEIKAKDLADKQIDSSKSIVTLDTTVDATLSELKITDINGGKIDQSKEVTQIKLSGKIALNGADQTGVATLEIAGHKLSPVNISNATANIDQTITDKDVINKILSQDSSIKATITDVAGNEKAIKQNAIVELNKPTIGLEIADIAPITSASGEKTKVTVNVTGLDPNEKLQSINLKIGENGKAHTATIQEGKTSYEFEIDTKELAKFKLDNHSTEPIKAEATVALKSDPSNTNTAKTSKDISVNLKPTIDANITEIKDDGANSNDVKIVVKVTGVKDGEKITENPAIYLDGVKNENGEPKPFKGTQTTSSQDGITYEITVPKGALSTELDKKITLQKVVVKDKFELTNSETSPKEQSFEIDKSNTSDKFDFDLKDPVITGISNDGSNLNALKTLNSNKADEIINSSSSSINDTTPTIHGNATADTLVAIYDVANGKQTLLGVANTDNSGNFTLKLDATDALSDGEHTIVAINATVDTITDESTRNEAIKNAASSTNAKKVTVDTENSVIADSISKDGDKFKFGLNLDSDVVANSDNIKVFKHGTNEALDTSKYSISEQNGKTEIILNEKPNNGEIFTVKTVDSVGNVTTANTQYVSSESSSGMNVSLWTTSNTQNAGINGSKYAKSPSGTYMAKNAGIYLYEKFEKNFATTAKEKFGAISGKNLYNDSILNAIVGSNRGFSKSDLKSSQTQSNKISISGKSTEEIAKSFKSADDSNVANDNKTNLNSAVVKLEGYISVGDGKDIESIKGFKAHGRLKQGFGIFVLDKLNEAGEPTGEQNVVTFNAAYTEGLRASPYNDSQGRKLSANEAYSNTSAEWTFKSPITSGNYKTTLIFGFMTGAPTEKTSNGVAQNEIEFSLTDSSNKSQGLTLVSKLELNNTDTQSAVENGTDQADMIANISKLPDSNKDSYENKQNLINSGKGDDSIDAYGGQSSDSTSATKADLVSAGGGNDTIAMHENTQIDGGSGTDTLKLDSQAINLQTLSDDNAENGEAKDIEIISGANKIEASSISAENITKITGGIDEILKIEANNKSAESSSSVIATDDKVNIDDIAGFSKVSNNKTELSQSNESLQGILTQARGELGFNHENSNNTDSAQNDALKQLSESMGENNEAQEGFTRLSGTDVQGNTVFVDIDNDYLNKQ